MSVDSAGMAARLGVKSGMVVQELGWDEDADEDLRDAITSLADDGVVWLLVPKSGRPGHVEPGDVTEVAPTAGLSQTTSISAAKDWSGIRLVTPKTARTRR